MIRTIIPILLAVAAQTVAAVSVTDLRREIERDGASVVASRLCENPEWPQILRNIERGRRDWLLLAVELHEGADAHTGEELVSAVARALIFAPSRVLSLAIQPLGVLAVCGAPDIDDPRFDSLQLSRAELARRKASVATMPRSTVVDECLAALLIADDNLRRFYGE